MTVRIPGMNLLMAMAKPYHALPRRISRRGLAAVERGAGVSVVGSNMLFIIWKG
jgi:hypothetical protein